MDATLDLDLGFVLADARTYRRLATAGDPLHALVLGPYVATFAVESLQFLQRRRMAKGSFGPHAGAISQARHALKFLDDSERGMAGVLATFQRMGTARHQMFVAPHKGLLGPLKRWLQSDVSVFVDNGRMIGTSDTVLAQHFSDRPSLFDEVGALPSLLPRAYAMGEYIGALLAAFGIEPEVIPPATRPLAKGIDVKSSALYRRLLRSRDFGEMGLAMLIASLLGSTNFVLHVLPSTIGQAEPINTWFVFKWRLITIFHVCSSLQQLVANADSIKTLRPSVRGDIVALRRATSKAEKLKRVRDALVHYDLGKPPKRGRETPAERLTRVLRENASSVEDDLARVSTVLTRFFPHTR
jgi:hypothetical protein